MSSLRPFLRFIAVGALNTLWFFGLFYGLHIALGLPRWVAVVLAFSASTALQYFGHAVFTFNRRVRDPAQAGRFFVTIGCGLAVTQALMIGGPRLGFPEPITAVLVVLGLAAVNWLVFVLWVFRDGSE